MPTDMKALARIGAQTRIAELHQELNAIYDAFPDLKKVRTTRARRTAAPRKKRKLSAAQKKAISVRMKKYWATRKKKATK